MNQVEIIKLALASILANKSRSFLTMLGVIIGVCSVILLASIGQGATASVTTQIQSLGTNLITVNLRSTGGSTGLTYDQVMTWTERSGIKAVAPVLSGSATAKNGNTTYETSLEGVTPAYADIRNKQVSQGRYIIDSDLTYRQRVAVIGAEVSQELFGGVSPVGSTIKVNGQTFTVIGVLKSGSTASFSSSDDTIQIPFTTAQRLMHQGNIQTVYVQAASADDVDSVATQLESYLLRKFRNEDSYRVMNQAEMLSTMEDITKTMTMMLAGIASISLLVGGIGIMNIMLVSVSERTREIGIRKAIGARQRDILMQFLVEALVVSGLGGIIGVILGIGGAKILPMFASTLATKISLWVVLMSLGFAVLVGVVFGMYPANKAAQLDPIEALRYE